MRSRQKSPRGHRAVLTCEQLEGREVPATLAPIADFTTPNTKAFYVPLTVSDVSGTVQYAATSSNSQVQAQIVSGGTTIRMAVSGTNAQGAAFQGTLTFRLFDTLAPATTARIISLINDDFYDGLTFHRVIDGFVAQGGDPDGDGTGGSGRTIDDEYNTLLTFNSPGLLAMAKSTDDTADSQFFITDVDVPPLQQPQHLTFNHTIFGILVSGFDTFNSLIRTPTGANDRPTNPVTIQSVSVVPSDPNGVLRVTAPANFTGSSAITVTPTDGGGAGTPETFDVTFVADTINDPPFLRPIADQTATAGTPKTFTLTSTDLENDTVTYSVVSATSGGQAVNLNPQIDQATGRVTVTPPAGFTGTIDLTVGVRDGGTAPEDTQRIRLTVAASNTSFDLRPSSDTGVLGDDDVTGSSTPTLTVTAPANQTVRVTVNGTDIGAATATATAGRYRITIPAGRLRVGTNTIAGTATPAGGTATQLNPFTLTFAPRLREAYVVPGDRGTPQQVRFSLVSSQAGFENEFGFFRADDATGRIGGQRPGDPGYAAAALSRRQVVFAPGADVGTASNFTANGGEVLVPYLVQNSTGENLLAVNPENNTDGLTVAFFGFTAANPDGVAHVSSVDEPEASRVVYGWEDLTGGGDRDYNDMVVSVRRASDTATTLTVPGGSGRTVSMVAALGEAQKAAGGDGTPSGGEVGVIAADDASGRIGTLNPGDPGYAAAALARASVLFAPGDAAGQTTTLARTGGQNLFFYFVPGGTAAGVRADNPTNDPANGRVAFFSIPAANPDRAVHFGGFNPEQVTRDEPTLDDPFGVHAMGRLNGTAGDFDDVAFTFRFGA